MHTTPQTQGTLRALCSAACGMLVSVGFQIANTTHDFPTIAEFNHVLGGYGLPHALLAALFGCAFWFLGKASYRRLFDRKDIVTLAVVAVVFGVLNVCGCNMAYLDSLMVLHGGFWTLVFLVCVMGCALGFFAVAAWALVALGRRKPAPWEAPSEKVFTKEFFICAGIIFCCWLPWLIAYYPATADYDSLRQISTVLGVFPLSNHDPLLSSVAIGSIFSAGRAVGGDNFGLFLFVLLRALVMACIYARCVMLLRDFGVSKGVCIAVMLFYALTPVWGAYAKQPFKDTFSAALFCWFTMRTVLLIQAMREKDRRLAPYLLFAVSGVLVALFRHNYLYVFAFVALVICIMLLRRRMPMPGIPVAVAGVVFCMAFNAFVVNVLGAESGRPAEALAIPLQQTARTVRAYGDEMTEEDKDGIKRLLDFDVLGEVYDPVISDPVKNTIDKDVTNDDYFAYLAVWLRQLPKYVMTYAEATFAGSYGYYAFTDDGYPSGGKGNCGMVVLDGISTSEPKFNEAFDLHYNDALEKPRRLLKFAQKIWHRLPLLSLTDTIPFYTWLIVLAWLAIGLRQDKVWGLVPAMLLVAILTCIASPVNGSFRYFVPIAASTPVLLAVVIGSYAGGRTDEHD